MTDFNAFNEWLWSCDPRLAVRVQEWHDLWQCKLNRQLQTQPTTETECIIDGRYKIALRIKSNGESDGFALYSLTDCTPSPIAIYQTSGPLFADLIAHSIRQTGHLSSDEFTREATRLLHLCHQTWKNFAGV